MILWWIANAVLLLVVVPLVVVRANILVRRTVEIRRYATDISAHLEKVSHNLSSVSELARTRELVERLEQSAPAILERVR